MKRVFAVSSLILSISILFSLPGCMAGDTERNEETAGEEETVSQNNTEQSQPEFTVDSSYSVNWEYPVPQGNSLRGVWGSSSNDIFAVGMKGTILHYDGTDWQPMDSGSDAQLNDVWGTAPDDVFACGYSSAILHYDGTSWNKMAAPDFGYGGYNAIWAAAPDDVYAVGEGIFHFNGISWDTANGSYGLLYGIWGFAADDIFAVGDNGRIFHFDGNNWTSMDNPIQPGRLDGLHCVWGSSSDHVIAAGETVLLYDGSSWTKFEGTYNYNLQGLWGSSAKDMYGAGYRHMMHYNGSRWDFIDAGIIDVFGFSNKSVFAVGLNGLVMFFNGTGWKQMTGEITYELTDIHGSSDSDIYAVGYGGVMQLTGETRREAMCVHYNGEEWKPLSVQGGTKQAFRAIWNSEETAVYATGGHIVDCVECDQKFFGQSLIMKYDGDVFSGRNYTKGWLEDIWGSSSDSIYTVGYNGIIRHFDGEHWLEMDSGITEALECIWGSSDTDIYAAGLWYILHYDGNEWTPLLNQSNKRFTDVWGYDATHVYFTTTDGCFVSYINGKWNTTELKNSYLLGIYGTSPEDVYVVGEYGMVWHYDGTNFSQIPVPTDNDLTGIWISPKGNIYISGDGGTILRLEK